MMRVIRGISGLLLLATVLLGADSSREKGIEAFRQGRYSIALKELTAATRDPNDSSARTFLALTQAALGDCQTATPELTAGFAAGQSDTARLAGLALAKCYGAAGDDGKTFAVLDELKQRFASDPDVLYLTARVHMKAFNDATLAMFQRTPASYRVHQLSGEILEVENRYAEAAAEYRKAIELNPAAPDLHFRLGRAILLQDHSPASLEAAAGEFNSELTLSPEDAACEFQLGQISQVQGNASDARQHFARAVELSPTFVQALIALAKIDSHNKQYSDAINLLSRAVKLQPANETAHYALLTAYRDSGQMENAKAEKAVLDKLQKPPEGEFSEFLRKLGEKPPQQ
jgi:tetratricopeptide (TPR) repeat protein